MKLATRRTLLPLAGLALILGLEGVAVVIQPWRAQALHHPSPTSPDEVLTELRAGNARYVASSRTLSADTRHDADVRRRLAKEQHPFAAVLCCADSRLCPEFIFDQGPGSFFEIRNAGNVVDDDVMASIEYAVEHLGVRFVLVLGHKGCGAIKAVHEAGAKPLHDHLRALQDHMKGIHPQVMACQHLHSQDILDGLSRDNAREQAASLLAESEPLGVAVTRGQVRLMFAMYDMETGQVEFFDVKGAAVRPPGLGPGT